jgi:hypothetical protein
MNCQVTTFSDSEIIESRSKTVITTHALPVTGLPVAAVTRTRDSETVTAGS